MSSTKHAIAVFDLTVPQLSATHAEMEEWMDGWAKRWVFQLEKGDTGYLHWQCRFSARKKRRLQDMIKFGKSFTGMHFSATSKEQHDNFDYCDKADTRIDGPWMSETLKHYVPRQYRGVEDTLLPWQKIVWESYDKWDPRGINFIYDPDGGKGKSTISSVMDLHKRGLNLPPVNDAEKLVEAACDILMAKELRVPGAIFIDMPRAMDKRKLGGLYSAIEQVKNGKVYDMRYKYREWWFDSPQVWVFGNIEPDLALMSRDRWHLYTLKDNELITYVPVVPGG